MCTVLVLTSPYACNELKVWAGLSANTGSFKSSQINLSHYPFTKNKENSNAWNKIAVKTNVFYLAKGASCARGRPAYTVCEMMRRSPERERNSESAWSYEGEIACQKICSTVMEECLESSWNDSVVNPCSSINQIAPGWLFEELKRNSLHIPGPPGLLKVETFVEEKMNSTISPPIYRGKKAYHFTYEYWFLHNFHLK